VGKWLAAKKDGRCRQCKQDVIRIGMEIFAKSAGVYMCESCGHDYEDNPPPMGRLERAAEKELSALPEDARTLALAENTLFLARQLDEGDVSPREVTQYTKEIRLNLMQLKDLYPETEAGDASDKAQEQRNRRMRELGGM